MATTYNNCQMGIVDSSGNLSVIYPQTKASLVSCDSAKYGGSSNVTNVQSALNNLSSALGNYLPLAGGTMTGSIQPNSNNKYYIGTSSKYFNNAYITTITTGSVNVSHGKLTDYYLELGKSAFEGGFIRLYNIDSNKYATLTCDNITTGRYLNLPDEDGTLATIGDILIKDCGWYPNGSSIYNVTPGFYQTSPNNKPSQGLGGANEYGELLVVNRGYHFVIYISVLGHMRFWASNSNAWSNSFY